MNALLSKPLTTESEITADEGKMVMEHFNTIFAHEKGKGLNDFNGHFWVELDDGSVLDDYDWNKELNDFKRFFSIKRKDGVLEYERCVNPNTNQFITALLNRTLTQSGLTVEEAYKLFGLFWSPRRLCCMFNAVRNQYNKGGKVVFGCVFMRSDDGKRKHYISGGEGFETFKDFKKPYNPAISLFI